MALAVVVQEVEMQLMVFEKLELPMLQPTVIRKDNKAYQLFADHVGDFNRTKHIDVRNHFARECIAKGYLRVDYVAAAENVAEVFLRR